MAASPETQIAALSSLLEVNQNVDKSVHLRCVETALGAVSLGADTALRVSRLIEESPAFAAEDKIRLQQLVSKQVGGPGTSHTRRCQQDYSTLDSLLTNPVWDTLQTGVFSSSAEVLMEHAYLLGLRLPTEPTFAILTDLLCYFGPAKSSFALSTTYETTKQPWRSFMKRKGKDGPEYVHLPVLPSFADLPEHVKIVACGRYPCVPPRVQDSSLRDLVGKIPMRKSKFFSANLHKLCAVQVDFGIYLWVRGKSLIPFQKSISYIYVFFGIDSIG